MIKFNPRTRRQFITDGLTFAIALPFLPSLLPKGVEAATGVRPKFLYLGTKNGQRKEFWTPYQQATAQFTGSYVGPIRELALSGLAATGISPTLSTPFSPHLSQMSLLRGLDFPISRGHNDGGVLGHFSGQYLFPTIDQVLAKSSTFYGGTVPVIDCVLLRRGVSESFGFSGSSFIQLPAFDSLDAIFDRIFNFGIPTDLPKRAKTLERVLAMYGLVAGNSRLSSADKQMLESQTTMIAELRQRLTQMQPLSCATPAKATGVIDDETWMAAGVDLIITAMNCGGTQAGVLTTWQGTPVGDANYWHGTSHNSDLVTVPEQLAINKMFAEKVFLRAIQKMESIVEANGKSMLYNSLIYWGNEISHGDGHSNENMPVVLAGSAGGKIRAGYIYDYTQYDHPTVSTDNEGSFTTVGRPYNQLLVTILQAMGLAPSDYERYGIKGYGANQSGSNARNQRYAKFMPDIGNPLPRIFTG